MQTQKRMMRKKLIEKAMEQSSILRSVGGHFDQAVKEQLSCADVAKTIEDLCKEHDQLKTALETLYDHAATTYGFCNSMHNQAALNTALEALGINLQPTVPSRSCPRISIKVSP
jgi:dihydroxyacid dehydratase/phosphogluconate dehydratase